MRSFESYKWLLIRVLLPPLMEILIKYRKINILFQFYWFLVHMVIQSEHYQAPGRAQREACLRWAFFICPCKLFIQLAMQPNSELTFARVTIVVSSCLGNPKYFRHFALRWRHVVAPRPRMSLTSLTLKRLLNQVRTSTIQTAPTRNWSMDFQSIRTRAKFL